MTDENWEKAKRIFADAIKLAPEFRLAYLADVCADDSETRREVESLLASFDDAEGFMESPAVGEVAEVIHQTKNPGKGKCFGHYEIVERIGAGGMGEVYLANDKKLNRKVAVKFLNEKFSRHESNLQRFTSEARAASALSHPNILVVHEIGASDDAHYIVSEFINGKTLREILGGKSLPLAEILDVSTQIVGALCAAHEAHLVHRDIKPENVMIRPDGIVKVLDFGLAKTVEQPPGDADAATRMPTEAGIILGTANYMSPEQARSERVDARTDIFSFGCVLYEMLTGRKAFTGETINHTIVAILEKEPPPLSQFVKDFPVEIERIVEKCLKKNAKERYPSAKDLLTDLKALKKRLEFEAEILREEEIGRKGEKETLNETAVLSSSSLPALPSSQLPNNLTENLAPIIGREKEIAEIKNLLLQSNVRLVTLTGVGGTGKTRLAQAVAQELSPDFPDGVFFVELAAVTVAEFVVSTVAQSLGLKESGGKPILEILKDFLRDKKTLLVIDNFEQVSEAAPQIRELLSAPQIRILITSRTLLRLSAEREFVVPPLAAPSEISQISRDEAAQYEAVKLFVERAQKAKPNFALTEENARHIAEICARLDGLPLAIELAAARVKILSPHAILTKLENRLQLLTGGARDLPVRQQTMRGAVEWSYELLSEDEKRLFRRLAVFEGGFTFEAAEAVCGGQNVKEPPASGDRLSPTVFFSLPTNVLDGVTSLVEKSLLVPKEQANGDARFQMLEVVREYALDALETGNEAKAMRRTHADYFVAFGEEAESHLLATESTEWLHRLEEEHENLRAALEWLLETSAAKAAQLAGALRNFWFIHNHLTEGRKWLQAALERGGLETSVNVRFKLFKGLGSLTRLQGDYEAARKAYEQGLAEGEAANDLQQIAHSNRGLGLVVFQQGDLTKARQFLEDSLTIFRQLGDDFGVAITLPSLGDLERVEGNNAAARLLFEESSAICRQLNNKGALSSTLLNLGAITFQEGNFTASRSYFVESLATAQELEDKIISSLSLDGFAALALKSDDGERAARLAGAAQHLREQIGYEVEPADRRFREAYLTELKSKMDESDFSKFYEQGRKMKLEEILALIENQP
jgi:predicted ATPase/tRNA A-37 threonylcarbamoyl transferase component Bud32